MVLHFYPKNINVKYSGFSFHHQKILLLNLSFDTPEYSYVLGVSISHDLANTSDYAGRLRQMPALLSAFARDFYRLPEITRDYRYLPENVIN